MRRLIRRAAPPIPATLLATVLLVLTLGACTPEAEEPGVVARVNGEPIRLAQLEYQHDLLRLGDGDGFVPTVEMLRQEYGDILAELIVLELVDQELERLGIGVSDEEVQALERTVRADYPDEETFEQTLVEEYIDIDTWRRMLRYHAAMEKFFQQVLRPSIKIDYKEAEDYYRRHIQEFYLPERFRLMVVRGRVQTQVEEAAAAARKSGGDVQLPAGVSARTAMIRADRLPDQWREALGGTGDDDGGNMATIKDIDGYVGLVLLEKLPPKLLDPTQAYPLVEEALLEQKLNEAFAQWLARAQAQAEIRVSSRLLAAQAEDGTASAVSEPVSDDEPGVESEAELGDDGGGGDAADDGGGGVPAEDADDSAAAAAAEDG